MSDETSRTDAPPTDEQWRERLTAEQYQVTRRGATEPPFSGQYWASKEAGTYHCVCCGAALFSSEEKYDSGTGWPSFWAAVEDDRVSTRVDRSHGMVRQEILCAACDAHLGHVFDDGPQPTGLRYCVNSAALRLETEE